MTENQKDVTCLSCLGENIGNKHGVNRWDKERLSQVEKKAVLSFIGAVRPEILCAIHEVGGYLPP